MGAPEDGGMKRLMEAVAQVTHHSVLDDPTDSTVSMSLPMPTNALPITTGRVALANQCGPLRKRKRAGITTTEVASAAVKNESIITYKDSDKLSRAKILEHNRLAAKEARRRKKHMVEELRQSVKFYFKANATLKSHNCELEYQLLAAKQNISAHREEKDKLCAIGDVSVSGLQNAKSSTASSTCAAPVGNASHGGTVKQAQRAHLVATQTLYKTLGSRAGTHLKPATIDCLSTMLWKDSSVGQTGKQSGDQATETEKSAALNRSPPLAVSSTGRPPKTELDDTAYLLALDQFAIKQAAATTKAVKVAAVNTFAAGTPHLLFPSSLPFSVASKERSPKIVSDNTAYLLALDRLVMKQTAANNAARAAAAAAMQAAHLRRKLNQDSYSPLCALGATPLSRSYPASALWSFQNSASFVKKE